MKEIMEKKQTNINIPVVEFCPVQTLDGAVAVNPI